MSAGFVLTPDAQSDLDAIQDFLLAESVGASAVVGQALFAAFARLAEHPGIGHDRADLTDRPVKFWAVYSYLIVYDSAARPVRIIRVVHAARDVRAQL